MRAGLAGDVAAYRRLLGAITPFIRAVARRGLQGVATGGGDVEDVVQEVLLAVHMKRHTWDRTLPLAPWLAAVARHKAVDALRRSGARTTVPLDDVESFLAEPAPPEAARGDAERMLAALPDRQRRIVQAMTLEERSAAEVGRELGMKETAVRVALHRALKGLATRFGDDKR
jgi:RNA polymerase sigma-70 factor (ECF subfamily)